MVWTTPSPAHNVGGVHLLVENWLFLSISCPFNECSCVASWFYSEMYISIFVLLTAMGEKKEEKKDCAYFSVTIYWYYSCHICFGPGESIGLDSIWSWLKAKWYIYIVTNETCWWYCHWNFKQHGYLYNLYLVQRCQYSYYLPYLAERPCCYNCIIIIIILDGVTCFVTLFFHGNLYTIGILFHRHNI